MNASAPSQVRSTKTRLLRGIQQLDFLKMKIPLLTLSSRDPLDANPPEDEHGAVMVDVKEADLVEFLPQDEKDRV